MYISIIIPTYNEETSIITLLESIVTIISDTHSTVKDATFKVEIIVVDGGSKDSTCTLVQDYIHENSSVSPCSMVLLHSHAGRALQMNMGAQHAQGEVLWFVHADSKLYPRSITAIQEAIQQGNVYGCFRLCFHDSSSWKLRLIAFGSTLRAKRGMVFGDQGVFVLKSMFYTIGEFPNLPVLEDGTWSRMARKHARPVIVREKIGTSARKFLTLGIVRTFILMQKVKILYYLGCSQEYLVRVYKSPFERKKA